MEINQLLANMSIDDLNQRYQNSYIRYGEKVVHVDDFTRSDEDGVIQIGISTTPNMANRRTIYSDFEWQLVDCTRPEAQYYLFPKIGRRVAGYFQPTCTKQYVRGFNRNNCFIIRGGLALDQVWLSIDTLKIILEEPRARSYKVRLSSVDAYALMERNDLVLQANLAIIKDLGGLYKIVWRRTWIGTLHKDGLIYMVHPQFEDEIRESIPDARFITMRGKYRGIKHANKLEDLEAIKVPYKQVWLEPPEPQGDPLERHDDQ